MQQNVVVKAELGRMRMMRPIKGVDQEGRIITLLVELNLHFYHLEVVTHLRSAWNRFIRLRMCLLGMSILMKRSVRWENLKIQRRKDGEEDITTWMTMKRVIKKRFVLEYYK